MIEVPNPDTLFSAEPTMLASSLEVEIVKAIWLDKPYVIVDDSGEGVFVQAAWPDAPPRRLFVPYSEPSLVVDPTDAQWAQALMTKSVATDLMP